jgi:xylulokinase
MSGTFLGINLGLADVRAILTDSSERIVARQEMSVTRHAPRSSWREQSPLEWWHATQDVIAGIRAEAPAAFRQLRGIGVAGQTQGVVLLDKHDRVLRPAILWDDDRARAECVEFEALVVDSRDITGNVALPHYSAPKLLWLQKHERSVFDSIARMLMPKDFLVHCLTGEFVTDMSDASSTLCFDVRHRDWSGRVIEAIGLQPGNLPRLAEGSAVAGSLRSALQREWGVDCLVTVAAGASRPAAMAVGLGALKAGDAFVTLGPTTLAGVTTRAPRCVPDGAVRNLCHCLPGLWHQQSGLPAGMRSLDWCAGLMGLDEPKDLFDAAQRSDMHTAPVFLPGLSEARVRCGDVRASGAFFGLTENTDAGALAYSILEGIAFSVADRLQTIAATCRLDGTPSLIGAGSRHRFWCELLATVCDMPMALRAEDFDAASSGAAHLARLAADDAGIADSGRSHSVATTILPRRDWTEEILSRQARFRRLNRALESELSKEGVLS